jgi:hypothetical protein
MTAMDFTCFSIFFELNKKATSGRTFRQGFTSVANIIKTTID